MKKILSVSAIENGTVIGHICPGAGMRIMRLLDLAGYSHKVSVGLNLPSRSMEHKDLIKVEDREITSEEAGQIAIFAPKATISIIAAFQLQKKFQVALPEVIFRAVKCLNPHCVTNHEQVITQFTVMRRGAKHFLQCNYCAKGFFHDAC